MGDLLLLAAGAVVLVVLVSWSVIARRLCSAEREINRARGRMAVLIDDLNLAVCNLAEAWEATDECLRDGAIATIVNTAQNHDAEYATWHGDYYPLLASSILDVLLDYPDPRGRPMT